MPMLFVQAIRSKKFRFVSVLFASIVLSILLAPLNSSAQTPEDEEIEIDSSVVILNATITNKNGDDVAGLTETQFEIFEDGVKQEVAFFETQETPFAAVILIDTSGSMEMRVSLARSATIKFLSGLREADQTAIYNFDSKVSLVQDFSNIRDLTPRVFDLKAEGWTVLNDAVFEAANILKDRTEKRKAIIVLSDGADTRSGRSASKALKAAHDADALIYTVDMSAINTGGKDRIQNRGVLKNFAEKTGGRFIETPGGVEMREAFETIVRELGTQYTLGYYPKNPKNDGKWRKIELKITDKDLNIRTREGYHAPKD
jgi:Ca-activated chloride channel homolog